MILPVGVHGRNARDQVWPSSVNDSAGYAVSIQGLYEPEVQMHSRPGSFLGWVKNDKV